MPAERMMPERIRMLAPMRNMGQGSRTVVPAFTMASLPVRYPVKVSAGEMPSSTIQYAAIAL